MSSIKMVDSLPSGVKFCALTKEKTQEFWDRLKGFDRLWSDDIRWDFLWFSERLYGGETILLETEGGLLFLTNIKENLHAEVHVSFWDCKLSGKERMLKDCMRWAILRYNLNRLEAFIPEYSRALSRFMEQKLGFTCEGRMRERMLYHGQFVDIKVYSILRSEV